jgi:hypothetical protein
MKDNKDTYTYKKYSSNKNLIKYFNVFIFIDVVAGIYFLIKFWFSSGKLYPVATTLIILIFLIIFDRQISKSLKELDEIGKRNYRTWGRGAGAELVVKRSLMSLDDDYKIMNDFQTGKWNIDHICVGPTGIFAIETKACRGTVSYADNKLKINGVDLKHNYLGQAKRGSLFLNKLIEKKTGKYYFVVPVLVFPHAEMDSSINHQIEGVWVGGRGFERWIVEKCNDVLIPSSIEEIRLVLLNYDCRRDKMDF